MELKYGKLVIFKHELTSLNCTFMELKCVNLFSLFSPVLSLNCTFMELKFIMGCWGYIKM